MQYFKVTTDLLNSENLTVAIAQQCNALQVCNFIVIADPKAAEKHICHVQNSVNATVFKLQVILLIMEGTKKSKTSYYSLSYWDRLQSYSSCCSHRKTS